MTCGISIRDSFLPWKPKAKNFNFFTFVGVDFAVQAGWPHIVLVLQKPAEAGLRGLRLL